MVESKHVLCRMLYDAVHAQLAGVQLKTNGHSHSAHSNSSSSNGGASNGTTIAATRHIGRGPNALGLDEAQSAQVLESLDTWTIS